MAIHAGDMIVSVRGDASKLAPDLTKAYNEIKSFGAKTNRTLSSVEKSVSKASKSWSNFSRTLIGGLSVYTLTNFVKSTVDVASALEEVDSKFKTVFRGNENQAEKWAKELQASFQLSERAAKEYLASIQDLLVPLGVARNAAGALSDEVVKLAVDIGSFSNKNTADVFRDIQAAMTGSFETMKKYGVALSVAAIEQKALAEGYVKTKDELTPAIKAITAFKLIVEGSTDAIGDAVKTRNSYANMLKEFTARWEDLKTEIGKGFIPVAKVALEIMTETINQYSRYARSTMYDPSGSLSKTESALESAKAQYEGLRASVDEARKRGPVNENTLRELDTAKQRVEIYRESVAKLKRIMNISDPERTPVKSYADRIREAQEAIDAALKNTSKGNPEVDKAAAKKVAEFKEQMALIREMENSLRIAGGKPIIDFTTQIDDQLKKQRRAYDELKNIDADYTDFWAIQVSERYEVQNRALESMVDNHSGQMQEFELMIGGWAKSSADAIAEFATNGKFSFRDMIQSMIKDLISFMAYQTLLKPLFGALSGGMSGGGGIIQALGGAVVDVGHSGGIVGSSGFGNGKRSIPAAMFAFAPRLHSGLRPDEFPAILQKGEAVIPKDQVGGQQSGGNYNITINAVDTRSFSEYIRRNPAPIIEAVNRNVRGNGMLRGAIRGTM